MPIEYIFTSISFATSGSLRGDDTGVVAAVGEQYYALALSFASLRRLSDVAIPSPIAVLVPQDIHRQVLEGTATAVRGRQS